MGILVVYIDNQSIGKDVWFDNLVVDNYTSSVVEEDHYYPYGLTLNTTQNTTIPQGQPYKYNTKELEKNFGLKMYDYGVRMQDPQLGVWHAPDAMAEQLINESPYCYGGNNPVKNIDIGGLIKAHYNAADLNSQGITNAEIKTFQTIINNVGNMIINNPQVLQQMAKITGLSIEQIKSDFTAGNGPVAELTAAGGSSASSTGFSIDARYFKYLSGLNPNTDRDAYNAQLFGIGLSILHEYAHYDDKLTNGGKNSGQFIYQIESNVTNTKRYPLSYTNAFGDGVNVKTGNQFYKWSITGHRGSDIEALGFGVTTSQNEFVPYGKINFEQFLNYLPIMINNLLPSLPISTPENVQGDNIRSTLGLP